MMKFGEWDAHTSAQASSPGVAARKYLVPDRTCLGAALLRTSRADSRKISGWRHSFGIAPASWRGTLHFVERHSGMSGPASYAVLVGRVLRRGRPILLRRSHHAGLVDAKVREAALFGTRKNHKSLGNSVARG
jgi:hypothetical protein